MNTRGKHAIWAGVLLGAIAAMQGAQSRSDDPAAPSPQAALATGERLEPRREVPDFTLLDQQGKPFTPANLKGSWSLLFFGYTNCPDVCPATLTTLAAFAKSLRAAGDRIRPRVIFVSLDAQRDTPKQLSGYVPFFDSEFLGVTAIDQPTIAALAQQIGVFVMITPRKDGAYRVDHSTAIFVVDPSARIAAILTGPFTVKALQSDFRHIVGK